MVSNSFETSEDGLMNPGFIVSSSSHRETDSSSSSSVPRKSKEGEEDVEMNQLDLLLSLDVALELIHADREAMKRVETFTGYPGHYGHRVRDTIEELFVLLLQVVGERHVVKGFGL
jgi:recyclin-1